MAATDKLHRWLDVLAALLSHRYPVALTELRRFVPGYDDPTVKDDSILRMFERDKDELRELGITIDTLAPDADGVVKYQLRATDYYLPLLSVCEGLLPSQTELRQLPRRPAGIGYAALPTVVLTPDESQALRRAAARVSGLGHPALAADAASALRKLQFDIDDFAAALPAAATLRVDSAVFDELSDAIPLRKRVRFNYHSMSRDSVAERTVDPYGLVFLTGHWYLVARDVAADALRQFRLSRIRDVALTNSKRQHPDFAVPADFDLSVFASSKQAWEIGHGEQHDVVVALRGSSGVVAQHAVLGEAVLVPTDDALHALTEQYTLRRFRVRRMDVFLRWLLSFAGDARPVAPPGVVEAWRTLLRTTRDAGHTVADAEGAA